MLLGALVARLPAAGAPGGRSPATPASPVHSAQGARSRLKYLQPALLFVSRGDVALYRVVGTSGVNDVEEGRFFYDFLVGREVCGVAEVLYIASLD